MNYDEMSTEELRQLLKDMVSRLSEEEAGDLLDKLTAKAA